MPEDRPIVVVTGAVRGLGREVAAQLAAAGRQVLITGRDPGAAEQAAAELGEHVSALPTGLDLADDDSVAAAAAALSAAPGRVDVLINNGAAFVDWTETASAADLAAAHQVMEVNLFGAWRLTQALLPMLLQSTAPRIVNVSSGAGAHQDDTFGLRKRHGAAASYGISKAALNALTSTFAAEFADTALLVNAVCPGLTATWPGAEQMGARPVEVSARGVVWAATLPSGGPSGGFFRDGQLLGW